MVCRGPKWYRLTKQPLAEQRCDLMLYLTRKEIEMAAYSRKNEEIVILHRAGGR